MQKLDRVTRGYMIRITIVLSLLAMLAMYTETMILPAFPRLMREFHVRESDIAWILTAYLLSGVASTPLMGKLSDIYGRKKILLIVLTIYAIGLTSCGFSYTFSSLVMSRAIQGVGMAMFPIAFSIVREQLPMEMVPLAQGMISAMFGIGSIIGLVVGSHVIEWYGWRTLFHTAAILAWGLIPVEHFLIEEKYRPVISAKIDYIGIMLISAGTAFLCYAFEVAAHYGWTYSAVIWSIITGIICYIAFIEWERYTPEPVVPLSRLKEINVLVSNLAGVVAGLGMFMFFQVFVIFLQLPKPAGLGLTIVETGYYMTIPALTMLITSGLIGRIIPKIGVKRSLLISSIYLAISGIVFQLIDLLSLWQVIAAACLVMSAIGALLVSLINLLVLSVPVEEVGLLTGINMILRYVGGSLGTALGGYLQSTITTTVLLYMLGKFVPLTFASPIVVKISMLVVTGLGIVIFILCLKAREIFQRRA